MSMQKLKKQIQLIKPAEFEELTATLLTSFLKQHFIVARRGDQPSGDARNIDGDISIQAKRYSDENTPNAKLVEGDIRQAIRTLPHLQVYVLALSRDKAQLQDILDSIAEETGLDIIILELTDKISDIDTLCVAFWEDICHFFDLLNTDHDFLDWVEEMKNDTGTEIKLETLKQKLESGIQSQYHIKKDVEKFLYNRFNRDRDYNPINLSKAIVRQQIESELEDWWKNKDVPICCLQGEEGTGKTWLAAKWLNTIHESEQIVTLWLDSRDWNGCKSIFDLLKNCFSAIYGSINEGKILKLQNKAAKIWRKTLIVLDGVNERNAIEASQAILSEYFQSESEIQEKIRLLFTARPLDDYPQHNRYLWNKCHYISVIPFNGSELQDVLSRKGMQSHDLPDSLKEIASIPRYFERCIELKDEFGSFNVVTKEMILLSDLHNKIKHSDIQIREKLGWTRVDDVNEFLSHLVQQIEWDKIDDAPRVSVQLLKECFSDYTKTRIDLEEQRIIQIAGQFDAELNADHVKLCWVIYLSKLLDSIDFEIETDYVQTIQSALEPIPSEDLRTEALFATLQITTMIPGPDTANDHQSQKRAALLLVWHNSHNAQITSERISFWVEKDTDAYTQFVEFEFKKDILPNEEYTLIEPLAIIWKDKKGQLNHLEARLTKWLLLTYIDEYKNSNDNIDPTIRPSPNSHFIQNRLTSAALSILSQRPERQLLSILAKCYAIHESNTNINEFIGKLMRWGYTDTVLGDLYWLAVLAIGDEFLLRGLWGLSEELQVVEVPQLLLRPLSDHPKIYTRNAIPFIEHIRNQEQLLKGDSPSTNVKGNYQGLNYLAVRTDLPDLIDDDFAKIKKVLHYISKNVTLGQGVGTTPEDSCIENLLPWVAKYDHEGYSELACNLKINTLTQEWAQFKLLSIQGLIFKPEDKVRIAESVIELKPSLDQNEDFYQDVTWLTHLLTETLLFCATEDELTDWFTFLASQESLRSSICYESLPYLLAILLPVSIVELAQKKLEEHSSLSSGNQNISADNTSKEMSEESYWCTLFSYGSEINEKTVNYALDDLKMREPDSTGTFPMLRLAYSDPKRLLDEASIDGNIQKHIFSRNGRRWIIQTPDENDVPSYELLSSFLPTEFIGSFLCAPDHCAHLTRWGKDLMRRMNSILEGNEGDSNSIEEKKIGINRGVVRTWAEQNQSDFISLSEDYLNSLSKSPWYSQILSDFTDVIHCMLLRFQPEKAMKIYQQWIAENVRTIHYNEYGIETFLGQLWNVNQCNSAKHVQLRQTLLEECQNDEEILFMTIAAMSGGGEEELWDLVGKEYLKSHHAKERCMGVSILPWFGTSKSIEILNDLRSNDPSLWVRNYSNWAYEVAQQEQSCREVYREVLQTRDLFRTSAVFEQIKPALTPTAKYWHHKIEEEEGLYEQSQDDIPKLLALIDRFWISWRNNSMTRQDIKIYGRKLKEYCRGEKLGFGSPPRLAPWWKPKK